MSLFDDVPMPENFTKLPESGTFTMKCPIRVDCRDLQRFMEAGGTIDRAGYRLFIDDPTKIIATNVARMAAGYFNGNDTSGFLKPPAPTPTKLKAGTVVYRVIKADPRDVIKADPRDVHEPSTWKVVTATIAKASTRQIKLSAPFPDFAPTQFEPDALGSIFFETPLQAVQHFLAENQHFLTENRLEIETLERQKTVFERAVAWAMSPDARAPEMIEDRVLAIMTAFAERWRWFSEDGWIVLEPPQGLIAAETMQHVQQCTGVHTVEAVFRAKPHPGVYLRFRLREVAP